VQAYRVKQWDQVHETAESRKYVHLPWIAVPTKQDGLGFRHMVRQKEAQDLAGCWYLILQVAAKGRKGARGWLVRNGKPLTAADLSLMTGLDEKLFARALDFFTKEPSDWLELAEVPPGVAGRSAGAPGESPETPGETAGAPGESDRYSTVQNSTGTDKRERRDAGLAARVMASRTQIGVILGQIRDLERQGAELTPEDRVELRKKRAQVRELQKKQAAGDFATEPSKCLEDKK